LDEYEPYNAANQMVRAGLTKMTIDNAGTLMTINLTGGNGVDAENFLGNYLFCDGAEVESVTGNIHLVPTRSTA
jgi:hypothetical protein